MKLKINMKVTIIPCHSDVTLLLVIIFNYVVSLKILQLFVTCFRACGHLIS